MPFLAENAASGFVHPDMNDRSCGSSPTFIQFWESLNQRIPARIVTPNLFWLAFEHGSIQIAGGVLAYPDSGHRLRCADKSKKACDRRSRTGRIPYLFGTIFGVIYCSCHGIVA